MAYSNEEQRRRWTRNNADLYIRQDAERFFLPGRCPKELKPRHRRHSVDRPLRQPAENPELALSPQEAEAIERERLAIRREIGSLRLELALLRFKYNSNQPRVPAGNPDGGQWTSGEGAGGSGPQRTGLADASRNDPRVLSDATPENSWQPGAQYAQNETPAPLQRVHPDATYESDLQAKRSLEYWKGQSTDRIVESLKPGQKDSLSVKPDGTIVQGNTRIKVLQERGYDVNSLPRESHSDSPLPRLGPRGGRGGGGGLPGGGGGFPRLWPRL
jgi:hypothetical protein